MAGAETPKDIRPIPEGEKQLALDLQKLDKEYQNAKTNAEMNAIQKRRELRIGMYASSILKDDPKFKTEYDLINNMKGVSRSSDNPFQWESREFVPSRSIPEMMAKDAYPTLNVRFNFENQRWEYQLRNYSTVDTAWKDADGGWNGAAFFRGDVDRGLMTLINQFNAGRPAPAPKKNPPPEPTVNDAPFGSY